VSLFWPSLRMKYQASICRVIVQSHYLCPLFLIVVLSVAILSAVCFHQFNNFTNGKYTATTWYSAMTPRNSAYLTVGIAMNCHYAECRKDEVSSISMLSHYLSVILIVMLSAIMLSIVAPFFTCIASNKVVTDLLRSRRSSSFPASGAAAAPSSLLRPPSFVLKFGNNDL